MIPLPRFLFTHLYVYKAFKMLFLLIFVTNLVNICDKISRNLSLKISIQKPILTL